MRSLDCGLAAIATPASETEIPNQMIAAVMGPDPFRWDAAIAPASGSVSVRDQVDNPASS
jgi:hypothetical protein